MQTVDPTPDYNNLDELEMVTSIYSHDVHWIKETRYHILKVFNTSGPTKNITLQTEDNSMRLDSSQRQFSSGPTKRRTIL
eukprot:scaffold44550_cov54-Cyclotella_meneghiniana.AAC.15